MSTKKVTFDDAVQIMGISEPHIDHEREKEILTHFMKEQTIQNPNPNKLFSQESGSSDVVKEQPAFLQGLQSLMAKRTNPALESENNDSKATENDSEKSEKETYTKDEKTGAWVSKDQIEAKEKLASINKKWTKSSLQEEVKLLRLKDENPELDPDETTDSPEFGQRLLKKQTGLHSLMSMKKSDIASKKDDNEPEKEAVQQYIKDGETGKWVVNPKWQEENSNQESDEPSETPAYLQNILAQKRRITKDKLEAVNKKWEEDYIPIITESSKL